MRLLNRWTEGARRYLQHARVLWLAAPGWSTLALALTVLEAVVRTGLMIAIGLFVGSLSESATHATWRWFLLIAALLVVGPLLQACLSAATARSSVAYLRYVSDLVAEVGLHPHGIEHLEAPDFASRLQTVVAATRDWSFVTGVDATWSIIGPRLAGTGALAVLVPWRWWVPLMVAASFFALSKVFTGWISLAFDKLLTSPGDSRRRATYLRGLLTANRVCEGDSLVRPRGLAHRRVPGELVRRHDAVVAGATPRPQSGSPRLPGHGSHGRWRLRPDRVRRHTRSHFAGGHCDHGPGDSPAAELRPSRGREYGARTQHVNAPGVGWSPPRARTAGGRTGSPCG